MSSHREEIQRMLASLPPEHPRRFSPELRAAIARYAQQRLCEGAKQFVIAEELGVSQTTITRVLRRDHERPVTALVPVRVQTAACDPVRSQPVLTVRAPCGLVIEGLDVSGVATLVRALS